VTAFDHTTERIKHVVWIQRIMAVGMALLLVFTIVWLRARLLAVAAAGASWPAREPTRFYPRAD
jgi:nitrate/nitrite-specific signal transduction histidine kinase